MDSLQDLLRPTRRCVCSSLRRASRAITQHYEKQFRGSRLRATQFTILSTLAQTGAVPITKLAAFLGLERTTLTRNLAALVERGFVETRGEADARIKVVSLSEPGEGIVREHFPRWAEAQRTVAEVLKKSTASNRRALERARGQRGHGRRARPWRRNRNDGPRRSPN